MKPKSIILLSGGLDSTVSAAIAARKTRVLFALTFDYGQRAGRMEILASKKICKKLKIRHKIIKLPFFKEFKKCSLLSRGQSPITKQKKNLWVPNRNGLFINIAAGFAEYYGAGLIVTGFNAEEARDFPDNAPRFIQSINKSLSSSTIKRVRVISYISRYNKMQIVRLGIRYGAPLELVYSCYLGRKNMCGKCPSCRRLTRALRANYRSRIKK